MLKKKVFLLTMLLCLVGLATACEKNATTPTLQDGKTKGEIIGYARCLNNKNDKEYFGVFIITEAKDSIVAFNLVPTLFGLDTNDTHLFPYGIYWAGEFILPDMLLVSIDYENVIEDEIISINFNNGIICPQLPAYQGLGSDANSFTQVIITNIEFKENK